MAAKQPPFVPAPPMAPPMTATAVGVTGDSPFWDRLTKWASENKTVVYTAAGVAVAVTGAGVVYYLNGSRVRALSLFWRRTIHGL